MGAEMKVRIIQEPMEIDPRHGFTVGRVFEVLSTYNWGNSYHGYWVKGDLGENKMLYPQHVEIIEES